jgi:hypothetical protein
MRLLQRLRFLLTTAFSGNPATTIVGPLKAESHTHRGEWMWRRE